ncbi:MAG: hypothetical protein LRY36_01285 [Alphaproteobacteria bacterium]|nr:hypothetical protein [Alphaproteobacteria bacterium]
MRIFFNPTCLTLVTVLSLAWPCSSQAAAPSFRFTANMNEAVNVDTAGGTPSIPITVGDKPRSAVYTSGSGTAALTFTYTATPGDLDLDGIAVSSPIALNGGGIADLAGNQIAPADLAFAPAPTTTGVLISYPSLSMDFVNDKYTYNGSVYNSFSSFKTASNASFSNDTNGTYFDAAGTLHKTAVANTPRMDYDPVTHVAKGVLLEEQRTNYQRDSEFSALSVASYAAYTEIASTWIVVTNNIGTIDITGKGTVNGLSYIDVHFQMNNVTGVEQYPGLLTFPTDRVAVTPGQSTMFSAWVGVSSYASSGACYLALSNRSMNAGGGYIIEKSHYWTAPSAFAPVETPILTHGAGAALAEGYFYIAVPAGATCDITMRYAAPQFEIGEYKTSYIPTAGATVTRAADVFTIQPRVVGMIRRRGQITLI